MTGLRVLLVLAGVAGMGFAVTGLLTDPDVRVGGVLVFLVGVLVLHDAVWMPLLLAIGRLTTRFRNRSERSCGPPDG